MSLLNNVCINFLYFYPLEFCDNLVAGSSRNPGDSFCFIDVENYFLKTEILDKTLEISVLYDVFSESELEKILFNIKESSS